MLVKVHHCSNWKDGKWIMGVGGCVCSSYGKFSENRHYSSKIRGNACSSGDPQLIVYNSQQSISDSDMNSSLSQKGRDLHHCQWCKCPQRHCWALAATSASHTAPCSCRCCCYEERCLSSTSWTWQEGKGQLLFSGVGRQSLFLETF